MHMPPVTQLVQLGNPQIRERLATQAPTHPTEEPPDIGTQRPRVVLTVTGIRQGAETVEAVRSAVPPYLRPSTTGRLIGRPFRVVLPTTARPASGTVTEGMERSAGLTRIRVQGQPPSCGLGPRSDRVLQTYKKPGAKKKGPAGLM
jgi:hypothetical protein